MFHISYSNQLEELAACLSRDLASAAIDIFATTDIVVPNRALASYLKLELARHNRVAANLRFPFLEGFLADRIRDPATTTIGRRQLHTLLASILADPHALADPVMAPVRDYLSGAAANADADAVELRGFQLAGQLARLFGEYELSRPELIAAWPQGAQLAATGYGRIEGWQRHLWSRLFADRGLLARLGAERGATYTTLAQLFANADERSVDLPGDVYMFGFSYLPPLYHQLLARLARTHEIHVYAVNPCMEFWEDLRAGWEARLRGRRLGHRTHGETNADDDDPAALRLWARPGREHTRALNELSQCDFAAAFVDPCEAAPGATALARLQHDILFRQPGHDQERVADPGSIRILACPGVKRELEIVGNEIWALIDADPSLRFNDCAVLVNPTDWDIYQAHAASVFGELDDIPCHLVDLNLASTSRIVEALELLLALPFGEFTRPELLRVITHPALLARFADADGSDWIKWSDELGVVHGADHHDHEGTYIARDIYNWDQGIRRLALGAFMASGRSGEERAIHLGRDSYVPVELPPDGLASASRFALLLRSLIEDARYCRERKLPLSQWRTFIDLLATSYLIPVSGDDERNLARCRDAIAELADIDIDGRPVGYRSAFELVRSRIADLRCSRGDYLADGVTIAPLAPMTAVPYRVIFIVGLGEGLFPTRDRQSPLDLRFANARAADVSGRERDRYTFLETLLSVRERLYLSYVARDEQTGETQQPSSVVLELRHLLADYLDEAGLATLTTHHPLRRFDPAYFAGSAGDADGDAARPHLAPAIAPVAHSQARAMAMRRDLEEHCQRSAEPLPSLSTLRRDLDDEHWERLRALLKLPERSSPPRPAEGRRTLSLAMVRRFLECPLQTWAAVVLRLRESEIEDLVAREDEPFGTAIGPTTGLLRQVFTDYMTSAADPDASKLIAGYRQRANLRELGGNAPTGLFSMIECQRHEATLMRWFDHYLALVAPATTELTRYHFGRASEHARLGQPLPPLVIEVDLGEGRDPIEVELIGQTDPVAGSSIGSLILTATASIRPKHILRGMVDQLALSAAGIAADRGHGATILSAGPRREQHPLTPWSRVEARTYLATLLGELFAAKHEYLLPFEAVDRRRKNPTLCIADIVAPLRAGKGQGLSSRYGPVSRFEDIAAASESDADAIFARRFAPLFDHLEEPDA